MLKSVLTDLSPEMKKKKKHFRDMVPEKEEMLHIKNLNATLV